MNHRLSLFALVCLSACTQNPVTNRASILGPIDLVFADKMVDSTLAVRPHERADGTVVERVGLPSGRVFVTSTDSSELRVYETFKEGTSNNGDWARAPNPLETLSIPVLDQPTMLVVDEGHDVFGFKVTGAYVYAARSGAAEVSVVSTRTLKQVASRPVPLPAPLTALSAWMDVTSTKLPATTSLYVATWDGATARVLRGTLVTDEEALAAQLAGGTIAFSELTSIDGEPIKALQVLPPRVGRNVDGAPFCDSSLCLALSTRKAGGTGRTVLLDPASGRSVPLNFGGQMRDFAASLRADGDVRLYGILDEEPCGGAACSGVVSVDLVDGTSLGGFPLSTDVTGQPMLPLRPVSGLIMGLTIAAGGSIYLSTERIEDGGITPQPSEVGFDELGAFSASNGTVSFFSAEKGLLLDANPYRADIERVVARTPAPLEDGGSSFNLPDGGAAGVLEVATLAYVGGGPINGASSFPWRTVEASLGTATRKWTIDIADGYFGDQTLFVINNGSLPGLVFVPTVDADGTRLTVTPGAEGSAAIGDPVRFFTGTDAASVAECGRASVVQLGSGFVEVDASPTSCVGRTYFSVIAGGAKPLTISADIEGYLGRAGAGETFVFKRRYAVTVDKVARTAIPAEGVFGPRDALTLTVPAATELPKGESAYVAFTIGGGQATYRVSIEPFATGNAYCYGTDRTPDQIVIGNIAMASAPRALDSSTQPTFSWAIYGVVPSGNAMSVMTMSRLGVGRNGISNGVTCRQ